MSGAQWATVADVTAAVFMLAGAFLAFAAAVGALRFPDLLMRIHTAAKPQALGLIFLLIGLALRVRDTGAVWLLALIVVFQLVSSPVGAHMVGRGGYRTGKVRRDLLRVDEFAEARQDDIDDSELPGGGPVQEGRTPEGHPEVVAEQPPAVGSPEGRGPAGPGEGER